MLRSIGLALLTLCSLVPSTPAQDKQFAITPATAEPPMELNEAVRALMGNEAIQFYDPSGALVCELWFCKVLPADATAEQIKNGLTFRDLNETQVVGAVRFAQAWHDYRKQKVKTGVYTLRLGFQPADGDHAGKSQRTEFLVLSSAANDKNPDTMAPKDMIEMSRKSIETPHPGVLMLFPNEKLGKASVEARKDNHVVVNTTCAVDAGGMKGSLGFGLTLVGEAAE